MFRILNLLLDVISIVGMAVSVVCLAVYVAAALAMVNAGDVMQKIDEWLHRG